MTIASWIAVAAAGAIGAVIAVLIFVRSLRAPNGRL